MNKNDVEILLIQVYSKICDHSLYTQIVIKKFTFFFTQYKNEREEHEFWRQRNKKSDFYENKKVTRIDDTDVNKTLVFKEEPYGTKNLNTLLDTMMMMLLDHYAQNFHK